MIKIIVVENNLNTQSQIKEIIRNVDVLITEHLKIDYYTEFNDELKEVIDTTNERKIYLLDIEINGKKNGIEIAKMIREKDWDNEIIFLTNHEEMFETVYRNVHEIYDFIEKSKNMKARLQKDIKEIYKRNFDHKMFKFNRRNHNLQIFYRSIVYIYRDKEERKLVISTTTNEYYINLNVTEAINYLDDRFKIVHRACIVNLDYVEAFNWVKGYFVLNNGKKIYMLSRKYKKEIEALNDKNS